MGTGIDEEALNKIPMGILVLDGVIWIILCLQAIWRHISGHVKMKKNLWHFVRDIYRMPYICRICGG